MAFDKNGKQLDDYTYEIAKTAVSEGRDELIILYDEVEYYISVCPSPPKEFDNPFDPYWWCCTNKGDIITIATRETIMDKIRICGQKLDEIWSQLILL